MFGPDQRQWLQTPEPFVPYRPTFRSVIGQNKRAAAGGVLLGVVILAVLLGMLVIA